MNEIVPDSGIYPKLFPLFESFRKMLPGLMQEVRDSGFDVNDNPTTLESQTLCMEDLYYGTNQNAETKERVERFLTSFIKEFQGQIKQNGVDGELSFVAVNSSPHPNVSAYQGKFVFTPAA